MNFINSLSYPTSYPVNLQQWQPKPQQSQVSAFPQVLNTSIAPVVRPILETVKPKEHFIWKNDLKQVFEQNKAVIFAMVPRTFNAKDMDGDELIDIDKGEIRGTFLNAVDRLDELKEMGVNTLHLLPIFRPTKTNALGLAGCVYAADTYTELDPALDDPTDPRNVYDEAKEFIREAHKRDIRVMIDLPSLGSIKFSKERPDLFAFNEDGTAKVPQGWNDVRAFRVWDDEDKRILNQDLLDMHKESVDMLLDLGVDGIRADVARYKPPEFWIELIGYAREKDPNFGFLAETYTYEDASPMANIPADRPEDSLKAGFDLMYGQYHIFHYWAKAQEFHDYIKEITEMSHRLPPNKGLIGSFATHDDKAPFSNGGVAYSNLTTALQATLPMTNPYFVSGFESGDRYLYPYRGKYVEKTETDSHIAYAHAQWLDIFNYSRKPGGDHPEIGRYMGEIFKVRKAHEDVITKGSYIPLDVKGNGDDQIIAYARHYRGKTLLVVANRNVNTQESGKVIIPTMKNTQKLSDLSPAYGVPSQVKVKNEALEVDLGPGRAHIFEIDTPQIERYSDELYKQNRRESESTSQAPAKLSITNPQLIKYMNMIKT